MIPCQNSPEATLLQRSKGLALVSSMCLAIGLLSIAMPGFSSTIRSALTIRWIKS